MEGSLRLTLGWRRERRSSSCVLRHCGTVGLKSLRSQPLICDVTPLPTCRSIVHPLLCESADSGCDKGHRRLLEHLADPACPSIRRFIQSFPAEAPLVSRQNEASHAHGKAEEIVNGRSVGEGCRPVKGSNGTNDPVANGNSNGNIEGADALRDAYNGCLSALRDFR